MNTEIDKELSHVILQTLNAALSPDKALIDQAQQQLNILQVRQEYPLILLNLVINQSSPFAIRQLSGVLFKQYVETHWNQNSEKFKEPELTEPVKAQIRSILPGGLADQSSKIRSVIAYSVASIANWDWPELWPELFTILLSALSVNTGALIDLNAVHGALETLTEIVQEVTDIQMPQVAPAVIPQIYKIFIDPDHYPIDLRKRSIEIFTTLVNVIADMADYDTNAGKKYLFPYLPDFVYSMVKMLSLSTKEAHNLVDNSLKKEIIKALSSLLKSFPKRLSDMMNEILAQVWSCLVQCSQLYVDKVVNSDSAGNENSNDNRLSDIGDTEDEKSSLENLVYQLFDFILILKEKKRYKAIIKKAIDELCYYAILYMQITDDQIENWTSNPEQFVQDEDEESYSYSVRISGQELIENISNDFKKETASAIFKAIERHMQLAQKLRETNISWWKIHESCLLAISNVKPILQDLAKSNLLEFNLNGLINQFVLACLHESNYPFLVGRALFTASRFPQLLNSETLEILLKATATALQENQNPIIRVSAMKSVYCFCDEFTNENQHNLIIPHLPHFCEGLIQMITQNSANQIGTLTMETLVTVLGIDEQFVGTIEAKLSPLAIALFIKNTNDPLVNSIITDIIKKLINNPYTNSKIEQRLMPTLVSILNTTTTPKSESAKEQGNFATLITSTLDLLTTILRSKSQLPHSDLMMNAFFLVANLCIKNDDTAILQSGGDCLRAYLSKSIDTIINWKDEKGTSSLNYVVLAINHMLDPKTHESGCSSIGKLINTLIRQTAHVLGDNLDFILKAVLSKMQSSNVLQVHQSLIMVFAHLVHSRMDAVLTFLSNLPGPTGKPGLEFLMTEWVAKQTSFVGVYECKISILALAKILEHAVSTDDKRFQNIFVRGDRIINPVEGIKTRAKAKSEKELYTEVPLLVRIYKLLINEMHALLVEKKEEQEADEYEEDEGEEDEESGEEENENKDEIEVDENGCDIDPNNVIKNYDIFDDAFDKDDLGEEDPDAFDDPLMKIDLLEYLTQYLRTLSQHPFYSLFVQHHNSLEREALKEIGITNA